MLDLFNPSKEKELQGFLKREAAKARVKPNNRAETSLWLPQTVDAIDIATQATRDTDAIHGEVNSRIQKTHDLMEKSQLPVFQETVRSMRKLTAANGLHLELGPTDIQTSKAIMLSGPLMREGKSTPTIIFNPFVLLLQPHLAVVAICIVHELEHIRDTIELGKKYSKDDEKTKMDKILKEISDPQKRVVFEGKGMAAGVKAYAQLSTATGLLFGEMGLNNYAMAFFKDAKGNINHPFWTTFIRAHNTASRPRSPIDIAIKTLQNPGK